MSSTQVPEGYKQTEVGVIPKDWNCVETGTVISFFGGKGFSSRFETNDGIRWLKIANVGVEKIRWDDTTYLPQKFQYEFKDYLLQTNDVVMALTRPIIGNKLKIAKLSRKDTPALLNQRVAKIVSKGNSYATYNYYLVQRLDFVAAMNLAMAGTDPPNIGNAALEKILIPIPQSPKEQRAIAQALSDVDALIASLDKLIAKQRQLKTAAMQQLLTGKIRLPGFGEGKGYKHTEVGVIPEDWGVTLLGDFTDKVGSGITPKGGSRVYKDLGRPFVRSQNVGWGSLKLDDLAYIDEGTHQSFLASEIKVNDVLLNITGASIGRCCLANKEIIGGNVNQHVCVIRTNKSQLNPNFLGLVLLSEDGQKQIDSFQAGGNREGLNFGQIRSFKIRKPRKIEEQRAIATVLSDMDTAIAALETRRAKTQAIKQGMMQELLTGRTRLV
jgi:type I restriction enzyme S subunit